MIDKEQLRLWWDTFVGDGNFTEIRILGKFQYSGYFKDFENLCKQIEPYTEMDDEQLYFVLNDIDPSCYGRQQCEKMVKSPKITTSDNDIIRRRWILCDFDPVRRSGTNSTDEMLELAHKKAQEVFKFLREHNVTTPIVCRSGNGWHLLIKVDVTVSDETTDVVKRFLKYLGSQFTDDKVDFDEKNFNNARISKLYSTVAKKGANLPEMPWRKSEIVYIPEKLEPTTFETIKAIADLLPQEEPKELPNRQRTSYSGEQFDLQRWLDDHGIEYKKEPYGASTKFMLRHCPWEETHSSIKPYESALFMDSNGKITFSCYHNHCSDKTWHDVRLKYEPDAYSKPAYQAPVYQPRQYAPQKPKYEIKEEIPELGKKWLSMKDIQKVDISAIPRVKTGIHELDRYILGLAEGEVTLLSGGNASGKSSFLNTLICNFIQQHYKTALWSGELPAPVLGTWIQMVAAGKKHLRMSSYGDGKYYVPNGVATRIDQWTDGKLFIFNNEYGSVWTEVFHDMNILLNAGVKVFILDNLMSLDIDLLEGDKNNKQKELILQIKEFVKKNHVHVILVAHPRKSLAFLRKNDISGTSDLTNVVDNVWICHRVNRDFLKNGAEFYGQAVIQGYAGFGNVIEICKNRMFGVDGVLVGMHYEMESRRFKNTIDECVRYGWEDEPVQTEVKFPEPEPVPYIEPAPTPTSPEEFPTTSIDDLAF